MSMHLADADDLYQPRVRRAGDLEGVTRATIGAVATTMLLLGALVSAPTARAEVRARPAVGERNYPVARSRILLHERVYTVYRPADLAAVGLDLPIFTWLGCGCAAIVTAGNEKVLSMLASAGYLVVAYGSPDPTRAADATGGVQQLRAAIDWALGQDRDPRSPLFHESSTSSTASGSRWEGCHAAGWRHFTLPLWTLESTPSSPSGAARQAWSARSAPRSRS